MVLLEPLFLRVKGICSWPIYCAWWASVCVLTVMCVSVFSSSGCTALWRGLILCHRGQHPAGGLSTATDYWMQYRLSGSFAHQGLWRYCMTGKCYTQTDSIGECQTLFTSLTVFKHVSQTHTQPFLIGQKNI